VDDTQKYKVISLLQQDLEPKDIADDLGVSYGGVLKLRREFEQAKLNNTVDKLINMENVLLDEISARLPDVSDAAKELTAKVTGLEQLSLDLQSTASSINTRARAMIMSVDSAVDLEVLTDILCKLQTAFVNKNLTQVNVQNNFGENGGAKYSNFLGDAPRD
jgi:hypothetical protein